jgi:hypothetical protein
MARRVARIAHDVRLAFAAVRREDFDVIALLVELEIGVSSLH